MISNEMEYLEAVLGNSTSRIQLAKFVFIFAEISHLSLRNHAVIIAVNRKWYLQNAPSNIFSEKKPGSSEPLFPV